MTTRTLPTAHTSPTLYQMPMSAAGLQAGRTDISFQNITPDIVRIDLRVTNAGGLWSPPAEVALRSAPLGTFLPWEPLLTLSVPPLPPHSSATVSGTAWAPQPSAPIATTRQALSCVPPERMQEFLDQVAREAREEAEREARRAARRAAAPVVAADPMALLGRAGTHWAGNIDILMRGIAAERHMARALRVHAGRTNVAMFFVGDRRDGYKFELSGDVEDWKAELVDMSRCASLRPRKAKSVAAGEFREFTRGIFYLMVRPPKDAEKGDVTVHVTRQSDGMQAAVEFSLDSRAHGAGCYTV